MKYIVFMSMILVMVACSNSPSYNIKGSIAIDDISKVYLNKTVGYAFEVIDSCDVRDGKFEFTGSVELPDIYAITVERNMRGKRFCLENTNFTVNIDKDINKANVKGSLFDATRKQFSVKMKEIENEEKKVVNQLRKLWHDESVSKENKQEVKEKLDKIRGDKMLLANSFISNNNHNPYTPEIVNIYIRNFLDINQLDSLFKSFSPEVQKTNMGKKLNESIKYTRLSAVGQPFIDFTVPNVEGEKIKLSEVLKDNKLVFVDFWASWCAPCRASIPHLKELYTQYHDKGLEIVAVSYDSKRDSWIKAIDDEELEWLNGSNLQGWACPTALQYAVRGIPATVLISSDGKIVARNLRGEVLSNKIAEILESKTES